MPALTAASIGGISTTQKENLQTTSETLESTTKKTNDTSDVKIVPAVSTTTPAVHSEVIAKPGNNSNRIDISANLINNILIGK